MHYRALVLAVAVTFAGAASAQEKSITLKAGTTDAAVLDLKPVTGQVTITADGNVIADCKQLSTDATRCEDLQTGSAGPQPNVTLGGTTQVTPDAMGRYPVGTIYTLQPRVVAPTTAEVCVRIGTTASAQATTWTGAITSGLSNDVNVSLDASEQDYTFQYRCFNEFGSLATGLAQTVTVRTAPGAAIGDLSPTFDCANPTRAAAIAASRPGFARRAPPNLFYSPVASIRIYPTDFPRAGNGCQAGVCPMPFLGLPGGQYISFGFRTPAQAWIAANAVLAEMEMVDSGSGQAGFNAYPDLQYITISTCPGDFRIPTAATSIDPQNDPTFGFGCRNFRPSGAGGATFAFGSIFYAEDGLTRYENFRHYCGLAPNQVYYVNIINADPTDGTISAGEDTCGGQACGMRSKWK